MNRRRFLAVTVGVLVLSVGLVLANYGGGVTPALAAASVKEDPHAGLPQNWDQALPANDPGGACPSNSSRFTCVMGNTAVRDNETGLVWEKSPGTTAYLWSTARVVCTHLLTTGNRKGWRLPSIPELASLVDPTVASPGPTLPLGHPFLNVQSFAYWSATAKAADPTSAWEVNFNDGSVGTDDKTAAFHAWCVRGGMNADTY